MSRDKRLALPDRPGVYRILRSNGDLLYVGKATSLKRRVNQMIQGQGLLAPSQHGLTNQVQQVVAARVGKPMHHGTNRVRLAVIELAEECPGILVPRRILFY